jgi:dethiobiotin synthetase
MSLQIVIAGTDTDIGKTVFAAGLTRALDGCYWKPIQAGLDGQTDSETVQHLSGVSKDRILPEAYRLKTAASPHFASERDRIVIDHANLMPPDGKHPLVIELAGGLAVPLTGKFLQIDLLARWRLPVIICASTRLGTINHTLLSIEALKRRAVPIIGIAFIGPEAKESQRIICDLGDVRSLGRLPHLDPLTPETLAAAFAASFNVGDILSLGASGS